MSSGLNVFGSASASRTLVSPRACATAPRPEREPRGGQLGSRLSPDQHPAARPAPCPADRPARGQLPHSPQNYPHPQQQQTPTRTRVRPREPFSPPVVNPLCPNWSGTGFPRTDARPGAPQQQHPPPAAPSAPPSGSPSSTAPPSGGPGCALVRCVRLYLAVKVIRELPREKQQTAFNEKKRAEKAACPALVIHLSVTAKPGQSHGALTVLPSLLPLTTRPGRI